MDESKEKENCPLPSVASELHQKRIGFGPSSFNSYPHPQLLTDLLFYFTINIVSI